MAWLWIGYWQGSEWNGKLWDNQETNTRIIKSEIENKSRKFEQEKLAEVLMRLRTTVEISEWVALMNIHKIGHLKRIF